MGGFGFDVLDVTDKSNMFLVKRTTYPGVQYCHQGWPSDDRQYLYVNDELDEQNGTTPTTRTLIFDISDINNPTLASTATTGLASIDHNLYMNGDLVFESNYTSGLRVFSAVDPVNLIEVAWFDTHPETDAAIFEGAWSVYPYFPSGTIIISDFNRGLFVIVIDPQLPQLTFTLPNGLPTLIAPAGDSIRVEVGGQNGGVPQSGAGMLHYDAGAGLVSIPMSEQSANVYDAVFPALPCGSNVTYYFSAETTLGDSETDPRNAPISIHAALLASGVTILLDDQMESDPGWTVDPDGFDTATTGVWQRVNPNGTAAQPKDDHTANPGVSCWVTGQGTVGGGLGENDVDGGATTLMSPAFDVTGLSDPRISYWRWYSNVTGASPNADVFVVDISDNDGASWTEAELIGPGGDGTAGGWIFHEIRVQDFVAATAQVRLRFSASDEGSGSIVEAAIDDLQVTDIVCALGCTGDLDGDGSIGLADLAIVLSNFGTGSGAAAEDGDLDGDGDVDLSDLSLLLSLFGTICP